MSAVSGVRTRLQRIGIGWAAPAAMAIAAVVRTPGLTRPGVLVFDEQYYAPGAAEMLQWGAVHGLAKHPPLGWWLIASGIEVFGFNPLGWRIAALLAGVATVGAVSAAVRRLTGDQRLAFLAGLLCALDGVMFSLGRLAMLDVFVGLFVCARRLGAGRVLGDPGRRSAGAAPRRGRRARRGRVGRLRSSGRWPR